MKRTICNIIFALGLLALLPTLAHAETKAMSSPVASSAVGAKTAAEPKHPDWYACEVDTDCVRDSSSCGGMVSVNQALLQDYHEANGKGAYGAGCPDLPLGAKAILGAMEAKCQAKHCVTTMPGAPSNDDLSIEWFSCSQDTDCFYDAGACGGAASINKNFRKEYHQAMLKRTRPGQCAPEPLPEDLTPGKSSKQATAICRNQMCSTMISASAPDTGKPDGRWMQCETDDDCQKVDAVCGAKMPMNKKYKDRMEAMMGPARSKISFACYFVPDGAKELTEKLNVRCKFNMCTLEK